MSSSGVAQSEAKSIEPRSAIEWFAPRMTGKEQHYIDEILRSNYLNDGLLTKRFEEGIAHFCSRRYAVAVPNGTLAITAALMACGALPGDDVIVPDFTFIATANAARLAGCNVVLADVDDNFCLTAGTILAALTPRTKFVITVEVNGNLPRYAGITKLCNEYGLTLISDSCEALGSGGIFGKASCLSFSPNKIITTGQGGMVLTNHEEVWLRLRQLKYQGMNERGTGGDDLHPVQGFNFKFTDLQAAVGLAQLEDLHHRLDLVRERDERYRALLGKMFPIDDDLPHLWAYVLIDDVKGLAAHLRLNNVGVREAWRPLHTQRPYMLAKELPVAESIAARCLWLPSSPYITSDQIDRVCELIRAIL